MTIYAFPVNFSRLEADSFSSALTSPMTNFAQASLALKRHAHKEDHKAAAVTKVLMFQRVMAREQATVLQQVRDASELLTGLPTKQR